MRPCPACGCSRAPRPHHYAGSLAYACRRCATVPERGGGAQSSGAHSSKRGGPAAGAAYARGAKVDDQDHDCAVHQRRCDGTSTSSLARTDHGRRSISARCRDSARARRARTHASAPSRKRRGRRWRTQRRCHSTRTSSRPVACWVASTGNYVDECMWVPHIPLAGLHTKFWAHYRQWRRDISVQHTMGSWLA